MAEANRFFLENGTPICRSQHNFSAEIFSYGSYLSRLICVHLNPFVFRKTGRLMPRQKALTLTRTEEFTNE